MTSSKSQNRNINRKQIPKCQENIMVTGELEEQNPNIDIEEELTQENVMVAIGENVVMQTALTSAVNGSEK